MPITKSAKKALRQNMRRRTQNNAKKEAYRRLIRDVKKLVAGKKNSDAKKLLPQLYKAFDKAAKTGAIKKNKASRLKSRLTKLIGQ